VIDGKIIGEGSVAGLQLLNSLIEICRTAKKEGKRLAVADVIEKLPAEAFELAGQFVSEIDKLRTEFSNIDPTRKKTIDELQSENRFWQFKTYKILRNFRPKVTSLTNQISMFLDDIIAIAHCKEAEGLIADSFKRSVKKRNKLEADADFTKFPVCVVLDNLRNHAQQLRTELHEMINPRTLTGGSSSPASNPVVPAKWKADSGTTRHSEHRS